MYAYFNDEIVDLREKCIQLQDRSCTFGDGLYEVIRIIDGIPIFIDEHLKRLKNSANYFRITIDELDEIKKKIGNLLKINNFFQGELYIQLSRGTDCLREHGIKDIKSNLSILTIPLREIDNKNGSTGAEVVSFPDLRHGYCSHKTVNLFAQRPHANAARVPVLWRFRPEVDDRPIQWRVSQTWRTGDQDRRLPTLATSNLHPGASPGNREAASSGVRARHEKSPPCF